MDGGTHRNQGLEGERLHFGLFVSKARQASVLHFCQTTRKRANKSKQRGKQSGKGSGNNTTPQTQHSTAHLDFHGIGLKSIARQALNKCGKKLQRTHFAVLKLPPHDGEKAIQLHGMNAHIKQPNKIQHTSKSRARQPGESGCGTHELKPELSQETQNTLVRSQQHRRRECCRHKKNAKRKH